MLLALTLLAASLTACASKPLNVPYDPANFGAPDPVQLAPVPNIIAAGDKIHVTVFQVDSLSGDFQVEQNGQIDFPLIGTIQAEGQTPSEFAKVLAGRLGEKALRHPNVQVSVTEHAPQSITVEGAVKQAAMVPVRGETTLLRAIALAGGTSDDADPRQVIVFRQLNGKRTAAAFDLAAIRRAEAPDPAIYPDDIVVVAGSRNRRLVDNILRALPVLGIFRPF
jgi:polysaccharide export outer membrane protein